MDLELRHWGDSPPPPSDLGYQLNIQGPEALDNGMGTLHHSFLNFTFMPSYENASVFHQTEWVDVDTISITLGVNVVVCTLALVYFWSSRRHRPDFFSQKRQYLPDQTPPDLPSSGLLSWIPALLAISEEEVMAYAGFDAHIFLRSYSLAFKVFAAFLPFALLVLIPVNLTEVTSSGDYRYASNINRFNKLSMSNIQHGDQRTWVHASGMYLLTSIAMYFLLVEYRYYTKIRHSFFMNKSAHQRTIVVEGVPKEMRSEAKLFTYFNTLYPNEVSNVYVPMDLSVLRRLIKKRQAVLDNLGRGLAEKGVRGEEQYHYTGRWCCRRERVNTVGFCSQELKRLNLAIATEQDKRRPRRRSRHVWGTALTGRIYSTFDLMSGFFQNAIHPDSVELTAFITPRGLYQWLRMPQGRKTSCTAVQALQLQPESRSISSVDMSYDLDSTDREAGPIERVVLQEDLGIDEEESEEDLLICLVDDDGEAEEQDPEAQEGEDRQAFLAGGKVEPALGTGHNPGASGSAGQENGYSNGYSHGKGRAVLDGSGGVPPEDNGAGPNGWTNGMWDQPDALESSAGGVWGVAQDGAVPRPESGQGFGNGGAGIETGYGAREVGEMVEGCPRQTKVANSRERTRSRSEVRGRGDPRVADAEITGGVQKMRTRAAKSVSPVRTSQGWGNSASPTLGKTPRLSVGLINVDPVKEAVKNTAQTLQNMRAQTFQYRSLYGATTSSACLGSKSKPRAAGQSSGGESPSAGRGTTTVGGSINDSSSGKAKRRGSGWAAQVGGGGAMGESSALLFSSSRRKAKKTGPRYSSRAFITFKSFSAATVARQHTIRRLCVEILLGILMILFPVLVTLLSFVFSVEHLMQHSQVINDLCKRSSLFQSMIEMVQPSVVIAVMSTLPMVLRWVGHLEGVLTESMIQMETLSRYFSFQVLNVFLVTAIAGFTVEILTRQFHAQIVTELVDRPSLFFTLLGETLPKVCGFFCDYVIIRAFTGLSMELVRAYTIFPELLALVTCQKTWARSPVGVAVEERRYRFDSAASTVSSAGAMGMGSAGVGRLWSAGMVANGGVGGGAGAGGVGGSGASRSRSPGRMSSLRAPHPRCFFYGTLYALDLLVVVVVMTYACVAPVVLIPALMFFSMAQVVYRHQLLYVYVPMFESGGSFFPKMFRRWIFALFTAQSTMIGMCLLKDGFNQAFSILFLMVLTYLYKRKIRSMYEPVSFSLPLEIARSLDLDRAESVGDGYEEDETLNAAPEEYLQPELREPAFLGPEDLQSVMEVPDETFGQ